MVQWEDTHKTGGAASKVGEFRLVVHHYVGFPPEQYLASCHGVFENKELKSKVLNEAKIEAEEILRFYLQRAIDALRQ